MSASLDPLRRGSSFNHFGLFAWLHSNNNVQKTQFEVFEQQFYEMKTREIILFIVFVLELAYQYHVLVRTSRRYKSIIYPS